MVVRMNKKQVQPATGVKVDPDRSMEHQKTKSIYKLSSDRTG